MNSAAFFEPLTPRGVAGFARADFKWLLLAQFIFAAVAAAAVAWFLRNDCFPTVQAAIDNLPAVGEIRSGQLDWTGPSFQKLAEGRVVAFDVDLDHSGQFSSSADFQIEFGRDSVRVRAFSLPGYADFFYPANEIISFNQTDLDPLWKAWRAEVLFLIAALTLVALMVIWWILATVYFLPVWLIGFFTNRDLNLLASWKLSCAALLPGGLLMIAGILLYSMDFIGLVALCFIFAAHFVLDWLYLFFGLIFFPRSSAAPARGNPFDSPRKS